MISFCQVDLVLVSVTDFFAVSISVCFLGLLYQVNGAIRQNPGSFTVNQKGAIGWLALNKMF